VEIPEDQPTALSNWDSSFRPGPARISPFKGVNDVVVSYWSKTRPGGRPKNPASYARSFNVKA
jgi:hypothetical protein